jgi:hypothetical protein
MADSVDIAMNSICPEPETCHIRITGLNIYCLACRKMVNQPLFEYDDLPEPAHIDATTREVPRD